MNKIAKPVVIEDINKSFGKQHVLDNVKFDIKSGEMFGLIGLNGMGKTTLIKILLSLLNQDTGEFTLFGNKGSSEASRKNIAYLPEKFHPSPFLKGKEFITLTLSYYGQEYSHDVAVEYCEKLRLDPAALNKRISTYSKGMTQKIGLISTLLTQAPLLILDEPMSGLDPIARVLVKNIMVDYVKAGNTVFFSSHILVDIDEICDRIAVMHDKHITFCGTPAAFKKEQGEKQLEKAFLNAIS